MDYHVPLLTSVDTGDRIPVIFGKDGLPLDIANRFLFTRIHNSAYKTAENLAKNIIQLYRWVDSQKRQMRDADSLPVDLYDRIKSGFLFSHEEIDSLVKYLSYNQRSLKSDGNVLSLNAYVSGDVLNQKIDAATAYLKFLASQAQARRHITDPYYVRIQESVSDLCDALDERKVGEVKVPKFGLKVEQQRFLLEVVSPQGNKNPFTRNTRYRNYLIVKILLLTGIRAGELLSLRIESCNLKGEAPYIEIRQNTHKKEDPRSKPPEVKTVGRKIYIMDSLAEEIDHYIQNERRLRGNAARRQPPYLFLSTRKSPKPLAQSTLNSIFHMLQRVNDELAGIHPHQLRHTFNDNLLKNVGKDMDTEKFEKLQRHLCGWASDSKQAKEYEARAIEEIGREKLIQMQARLFGAETDLQKAYPDAYDDIPF